MKAFLTGATGFVGSHLADALIAQAHQITCLVRTPAKAERLRKIGVRLVTGDLHSTGALRAGIRGADVVFHVAGLLAARSAEEFYLTNREGTKNVIDACAANGGVRLVFVSSLAAAGPSRRGHPLVESAAPHPVTMYG
ncbi:MAG: NAD-dependent epimerase/dehydratase family protein, partial [Gemmatimonadales bacterium]